MDAEWNAALDEACSMCALVAEDCEPDRHQTYADGWEAACARCEVVIRDLKTKPDKEQQT